MTLLKTLEIAIVGNEDQVNLMRLAGIRKFHVIEKDIDENEKVKSAIDTLMKDNSIGIIIIPDTYSDYVADFRYFIKEKKLTTPVIIEIPSRFTGRTGNVKEFYERLTKKLIGFTIEL